MKRRVDKLKNVAMQINHGVAIALVMIGITGCGVVHGLDRPINIVEDGMLPGYNATTVGKAFDGTFQNPKWTSFVSAKGATVVEFNGTITPDTLAKNGFGVGSYGQQLETQSQNECLAGDHLSERIAEQQKTYAEHTREYNVARQDWEDRRTQVFKHISTNWDPSNLMAELRANMQKKNSPVLSPYDRYGRPTPQVPTLPSPPLPTSQFSNAADMFAKAEEPAFAAEMRSISDKFTPLLAEDRQEKEQLDSILAGCVETRGKEKSRTTAVPVKFQFLISVDRKTFELASFDESPFDVPANVTGFAKVLAFIYR
jgi:hypothetical protein